ncbi:MAG: hypothetical protein EOR07_32990 [Mesorhizobium sp.]|nr:MAG: hypothetical protein EOR07_32990 [Mesorhizobium sp.]
MKISTLLGPSTGAVEREALTRCSHPDFARAIAQVGRNPDISRADFPFQTQTFAFSDTAWRENPLPDADRRRGSFLIGGATHFVLYADEPRGQS